MPLNIVEILTTASIVVFSVVTCAVYMGTREKREKDIADRITAGVYGALHDSTLLLISSFIIW